MRLFVACCPGMMIKARVDIRAAPLGLITQGLLLLPGLGRASRMGRSQG